MKNEILEELASKWFELANESDIEPMSDDDLGRIEAAESAAVRRTLHKCACDVNELLKLLG